MHQTAKDLRQAEACKGGIDLKTISLWQPWASLIALKYKRIETRSWYTSYRGVLAIHACKGIPRWAIKLCIHFIKLLRIDENEYNVLYELSRGYGPLGKIVATCRLVDCVKIVEQPKLSRDGFAMLENGIQVSGNELSFGDYTVGRYAWILEDVQPLKEPVPAKGMQGLWNLPLEVKEMIENG